MKWIKNEDELQGAVIQGAVSASLGTMRVLFLDGDRAVCFESDGGDDVDIVEPSLTCQMEVGAISREEFDRIHAEAAAKHAEILTARELELLARLMAKYPEASPTPIAAGAEGGNDATDANAA